MDHAEGHLAAARDWYLEGVDAIPAEGWTKPSLCAGWTAAHVVAHVATGDQLVRGLILDALGGDRQGQDLPADFADRQRRMQLMTAWEPSRLAEASRRDSEQLVAALEDAVQRAPTTVITMPFGEAPLTTVRARRINEYVIHGYDLSPAIGRRRPIPTRHLEGTLGEVVMTMARLHQRSPHKGRSASFHFHRTDG
ncbi:MAG TPA: maleylpyruvate isomerase family mycothiol-dependent enzyme, partial [Candidatus Limnocylindrales bacterium]|nr:maleylpyruvate isomerase family mycothiol-dependent enzyme [Candidatus Limnocylindrales bacterium]